MSTYTAPLRDMQFVLKEIAGLDEICALPGNEECSVELVESILEEASKFATGVLDPINRNGDQQGAVVKDGVVTTSPGFKDAYKLFCETGWNAMPFSPEYGGQGLPAAVTMAVNEMWKSANMAFALCPMLTGGAIEAIAHHASDELKQKYLPKMVEGTWTGTMNLTEPQAGSDLSLVRSRAERNEDGSFKVFGTKIFITWGEHDMAENIIHLTLARVAGAPEGVKGISLFVVPKFLVNADGSVGDRNDVHCVSIEHKLGIKASPTCVLQFGDNGGATGYLVGEENRGLEYMFIMMNAARYAVGVQGISIAERSYQHAVNYARERVQSRPVDGSAKEAVAIIQHPDIKRMLMTMRAYTEGARALSSVSAAAFDAAHHHPDAAVREEQQALYEFTVPLVKGFSTEMSQEVTSLGVQVHGGMGFIEETGAAQYYRDSKILTIYEGTTAIQSNDLVGRKTVRDGGELAKKVAGMVAQTEAELAANGSENALAVQKTLSAAREAVLEVVDFMVANGKSNPNAAYAGSVPYLMLTANMVCGWQLARSLLVAEGKLAAGVAADDNYGEKFYQAKVQVARFYADHILSKAPGVAHSIVAGHAATNAINVDLL